MKRYFYFVAAPILLGLVIPNSSYAQATYTSANFAGVNDTVYLTKAQIDTLNFDTTGAGIIWDYSALTGISQRILTFNDPTNTGFTFAQWPYIFNPSNVNIASTDNQTITLGSIQRTEPFDYFYLNTSSLQQRAMSYKLVIGTTDVSVKTVYTSNDVVYEFPLNFSNTFASNAYYNSSIPGVYYHESTIQRSTNVNGWGTLITPYGTYTNCLKTMSTILQIDSTQLDTITVPVDTMEYREFKWLDPAKNYPLLTVKQTKVGSFYITQSIEYYDIKQYFQPQALFAYLPVLPIEGDTVTFQNLSLNGTTYSWNFGDTASGVNNTSVLQNPQHIFADPGTYLVSLIVYNGALSDTIVLPVVVGSLNPPVASFTFAPVSTIYEGDTVYFNNTSIDGLTWLWNFGDTASGTNNLSVLKNPVHVYANKGIYTVQLIAFNNISSDTATALVTVDSLSTLSTNDLLTKQIRVYPNPANDFIHIQNIEEGSVLIVYDVQGNIVFKSGYKMQLDIRLLERGFYFLEVQTANRLKYQVKFSVVR